jgi:basic amino acid/polyamine antiporter, APA family
LTASAQVEHRAVAPIHLLALGVNGIVGVGIFFAPADVAARAPGAGMLVFAGVALALAPVAIAFATLGARFDEDGGPVVFARAAFGPFAAFVVGWIAYMSAIASCASVIVGLATFSGPAIGLGGPVAQRAAATLFAAVLALVCASGLRLSAGTWTTLTAVKLLPLLALALVFLFAPAAVHAPAVAPALPAAWGAAGLVTVFAYQGFEIVPVLAGEARRPSFSVPFATLGSLALAAALYVVLYRACETALPALAASTSPLVDAAAVHGGPGLAAFVGAGTSLSAVGISFGMMAATPFYLAALARVDRLGGGLEATDIRNVPRRALLVTWALVTLLIQLGGRTELFALSSIAVLSQYLVTSAALLALALKRSHGLRPAHAAIAVPAGLMAIALVAAASPREAAVAAAALVGGLVVRGLARRRAAAATSL